MVESDVNEIQQVLNKLTDGVYILNIAGYVYFKPTSLDQSLQETNPYKKILCNIQILTHSHQP